MSYMRNPVYAYSTGDTVEIHDDGAHVSLPLRVFDALVLMRTAQLLAGDDAALTAAWNEARLHYGNFGTFDLQALDGRNPRAELDAFLRAAAAEAPHRDGRA